MILAVNTSSVQFSVALMRDSGALNGEYSISSGPTGSRPLFPALKDLLARTDADLRKIAAVAVATGPGSFTGLRVGLAMAKGLCQALDVPLIGVPTLRAMAVQVSWTAYPVCSVIGARKGEVFAALFDVVEGRGPVEIKEDTCLQLTDLSRFVEERAVFVGDDFESQAGTIIRVLGDRALLAPGFFWNPKASAVGALALQRFHEGRWDDMESLVPTYLRPPDIRPEPFRPSS
ncbi:MAG: tRNA (adenosine(37)-N6)-threonylcarbamoyltransferase complex dimerization subunit type 1 TsaB [Deltaproteobacteria bacterium]|nr:tRNA (adenosine(37)-N6)-threonylcarbamoyltransferase complex dimerization subunit type 1 TsaB [Deltaproteobacteria bacterium]